MGRRGVILVIIVFLGITCKENNHHKKEIELENAITKNFGSFITNAWNHKNMDSLRSITVENYSRRLNGIMVAENHNELEANMNIYFNGFPDLKVSIKKTIIKDNHLYTSWTFKGTNTGTFGESAATGKRIAVNGFSEVTFNDEGKLVKEDIYYNELSLLQQMGYSLVPPIVE
ncbi:ester cyclase [Maribacter polysiphoniae]|uniref:Ester cyclase n=1 Tax=Maribacter polysiphoniae TaxID=429344 RepID=A0A316E127_9FLAO|nr:ester cyclase [Maribacter polysiphoniae]MBD1261093.1 ester cyclase [Maribacter polysiphoniae]PWK23666.1 steroid delta-isomerase-like uncharacterized protein [Maribacter polysiphoniae]